MELLTFIALGFAIASFLKAGKLEKALQHLEAKHVALAKLVTKNSPVLVSSKETEVTSSVVKESVANMEAQEQAVSQEQEEYHKHKEPVIEAKESAFVTWLKEDWLLKLGGVLVLMGVLFFLSVAYRSVGPEGKVTIGYLFGLSLMVGGFRYIKKSLIPGSALHLLGALVILITTYVAQLPTYQVFSATPAFVLMFLVAVCVSLTAYFYNRAPLAYVALFISSLIPLLVQNDTSSFFQLLLYLLVVVLSVLWLAFLTTWRTLVLLALGVVGVYSYMYIYGGFGQSLFGVREIMMVIVFAATFYLTSLFSIVRSDGKTGKDDGVIALANAAFALLWIIGKASPELAPIWISFVAFMYALGFFFVMRITNVYTSFLVYGGVTLGMVATAITLELTGSARTVTLLLLGMGASMLTYGLSRDTKVTAYISLFHIVPLFAVLTVVGKVSLMVLRSATLVDAWKELLVIGVTVAVYTILYHYFKGRVKVLGFTALLIAILSGMTMIWEVFHLITSYQFATQLSLFVIGILLTWITARIFEDDKITEKVAYSNILTFVGVLSSVSNLFSYAERMSSPPDAWKDWVCVSLVLILAYTFSTMFKKTMPTLGYGGLFAGLFLTATSVWQIFHLTFSPGVATFLSMMLYTLVGLYNLWTGTQEERPTKVKIARVWLGFVAARIIFFDAWHLGDVTLGVFICIVVGVMLISSAFIIKKSTPVREAV